MKRPTKMIGHVPWHRLGLAAGAILCLALALAGATVVLAIVDSVLRQPLPYPDQERIVQVRRYQGPERIGPSVSAPVAEEFLREQESFSAAAAVEGGGTANVTLADRSISIQSGQVTPGYFDVIGLPPQRGRWFDQNDLAAGSHHLLVISDAFWRSHLGGTDDIIGSSVTVQGTPHVVVGVAPPEMRLEMFDSTRFDAVSPLDLSREAGSRGSNSLMLWGRLADDSSLASAQAEMTAFAERLASAWPDNHSELRLSVEGVAARFSEGTREVTRLFSLAIGLLLLVGGASMTNLVLADVFQRRRETATRIALGARPVDLVTSLAAAVLSIVTISAAVGVSLAYLLIGILMRSADAWISRAEDVAIGPAAIGSTLLVAWGVGLVVVAIASRQLREDDLAGTLRGGSRGGLSAARQRTRRILVVAQIALSLVLLLGAALLAESLRRLSEQPLGFDPEGLVAIDMSIPFEVVEGFRSSLDPDNATMPSRGWALIQDVEARIRATPVVLDAGTVLMAPVVTGSGINGDISVVGDPPAPPGRSPLAEFQIVSEGYLRTMDLRILRGQGFSGRRESDVGKVLVNSVLVDSLFGSRDPIGAKIQFSGETPLEIIGVVESVRQNGPDARMLSEVMFPYHVTVPSTTATLMVRARSLDEASLASIREAVQGADGRIVVVGLTTLGAAINAGNAERRFLLMLMGLFGLTALGIALVGLYAVMNHAVAQRSAEFGVRMALGATRGSVRRLIMVEGLWLLLAGLGVGLALAWQAGQGMEAWLFGVEPLEPLLVLSISLLLFVLACLSLALPALRASRVSPAASLRQD